MATAFISTNTELSLVNTITQNLTLYLPQDPPNGKSLYVKDAGGNSQNSTITLRTQGTNIFEDGSVFQTLNSAYESMQYNYNSNIWYFTGGTMLNTLRVSSIQAQTSQLSNLSSANLSVSSFQISNRSTIGTFNAVSSFLLYNGFNIGGGLRTAILQNMNTSRFSLYSIPGFSLWLDSADSNTTILSGANVTRWNDKSGSGFNAISPAGSNPTLRSAGLNGLNTITFNGTSQFFQLANANMLDYNVNDFAIFSVAQLNLNNNIQNLISKNSPGLPQWRLALENNQIQLIIFNIFITSSLSSIAPSAGWALLSGMVYRNTGNVLVLNGTSISTGVPIGGSLTNSFNTTIGAAFSGGYARFWAADMAEILVFNASLTTFQRQQVEGYLAWKWGIQANLPANHPFKNAPPQ